MSCRADPHLEQLIDETASRSRAMLPGSPARVLISSWTKTFDLASPFHEQFTENASGPRAGEVKHHRHPPLTRSNELGIGTWSSPIHIEQMEG